MLKNNKEFKNKTHKNQRFQKFQFQVQVSDLERGFKKFWLIKSFGDEAVNNALLTETIRFHIPSQLIVIRRLRVAYRTFMKKLFCRIVYSVATSCTAGI